MRIDKFLKVSRVIKRRTVATKSAPAGRVSSTEAGQARTSAVKEGDIVEVRFGTGTARFRVLSRAGDRPQERGGRAVRDPRQPRRLD
jgi:ribosomal 50S subunit-recycling heat shock protein